MSWAGDPRSYSILKIHLFNEAEVVADEPQDDTDPSAASDDDTGMQVLKEEGRASGSKSALWICRGGPPDKPAVLVDCKLSKSGETVYKLLS